MEKAIEVTCAIIIKNGRILATQRSDVMTFPLKWEFPGGKIKNGESAEDCIRRELKEELEIEVFIERKLSPSFYSGNSFSILLIPFIARFRLGKINLIEHKAAKWVNKTEMRDLDWAPADLPIVNLIISSNFI